MVDVFISMTLPAHGFEVVKVKSDTRIVYIVRSYLFYMMDDDCRSLYSSGQAVLTFISYRLKISLSAILPCLGLIKPFGVWFDYTVNDIVQLPVIS